MASFIGAHGAGLMHVMFMAEEGVLVEIHPSYRLDRHFRLASRMSGKIYLPMRTTGQVSCRGGSVREGRREGGREGVNNQSDAVHQRGGVVIY